MVTLHQAVNALFKDVLSPTRLDSDLGISHLKRYWHKQLEELSAEELAYSLTVMIWIGVNMTQEERKKWCSGFFRKNPIIELAESGQRRHLVSLL